MAALAGDACHPLRMAVAGSEARRGEVRTGARGLAHSETSPESIVTDLMITGFTA